MANFFDYYFRRTIKINDNKFEEFSYICLKEQNIMKIQGKAQFLLGEY